MKAGIGYSDNPDSATAGAEAAEKALKDAGRNDPCDLALLFSTARHDQDILREAVASVTGKSVPVYGGGAVGVITNEYFGYAGDQTAIACIWLDGVRCEALVESGLENGEEAVGVRLGKRLSSLGINSESPVMLFYDAIFINKNESAPPAMRMLMATWILEGIKKGLGFFPDLTGAGLMGDHVCSPTRQWTGDAIGEHSAIALAFSGDIRIDSVIMHGCRPSTSYYTVTKAAGQVILEINGIPALKFLDELLGPGITPEQYPFFLIFGVNHGDRWGKYDEDYYASRLCLGIDRQSNGIVMFEPDMVEGTEFQIMFQSMELDYIKPKIDRIFNELEGREPVFAIYIDCAGRCAGYGGTDMEDALVIQQTVAGRVPVLGLYTGVEIASIGGRPRGLDWTGVFCLFSQSKDKSGRASVRKTSGPAWISSGNVPSKEIPVDAIMRINEQNAAKILELTANSIAIRNELEQKRRGFSLLAELTVSLKQNSGNESVFITAARRINAALNMQRTAVLLKNKNGKYSAIVLQGFSIEQKSSFAGRQFELPAELLNPANPVLVTGADPAGRLGVLREDLGLPYLVSSTIQLQNQIYAILITGRMAEAPPYMVRLNSSDAETVQAVCALLASVLGRQRLAAAEEQNRILLGAMPVSCIFWDENGNLTDCNRETLSMFRVSKKEYFLNRFNSLSPEYQPDGRHSVTAAREEILKAFVSGSGNFKWIHLTSDGEQIPTEVRLIRVPRGEDYILAGYIRDLRDQEAAIAKEKEALEIAERYTATKNEFLASVSHEIRTPLNAIQSMARLAGETSNLNESQQNIINNGLLSIKLLTSAIETIMDFSKLDSGRLSLETSEFSVAGMVESVRGIVQADADAKSLYLRVTVDPAIPNPLLGDLTRLQQAFLNIVINAVKFTDTGGIEIRVAPGKRGQKGKFPLVLEVEDTGIGIGADKMDDLFKPFFSGDSSYTRRHTGMGMGLPISHGLATLMGGKITCESVPGKGSIFRLFISLSLPDKKSEDAEKAHNALDIGILHGMRVLVAEDNQINQIIMEELLASAGVLATIAPNGIKAIEKLNEGEFDLVLMDIQMPEMDGLTATAQIRSDPRFKNLPILAMTANAGAEHLEESINAGMNDHMTKPVEVEKLYNALIKWGKRG